MSNPSPRTDSAAAPPTVASDGASPAAVDARLGTVLGQGKYRLTACLGSGGMGVVYEAEDIRLGRRVAIKLLRDAAGGDANALESLLAEARAAGRLNHANVVTIYEVDQTDGVCYIVMELLRGGSAAAYLLRRGPLDWEEATRITADACRGLSAAHEAGLVHRDVKPGNLLFGTNGAVKLADFGLAKVFDPSGSPRSTSGSIRGTPDFMSPEQCQGEPVDGASDVYSLGATYYTLLTGTPPYPRSTGVQVMYAHCHSPVPDPRGRGPALPDACAAVVKRAMAKHPADRFASAAEMLVALEAIPAEERAPGDTRPLTPVSPGQPLRPPGEPTTQSTTGGRPRWRRRAVLAGGIAALLLLIWLIGWPFRMDPGPPTSPVMASKPAGDARERHFLESAPIDWTRARRNALVMDVGGPAGAVAFSPDGRWFAVAVPDSREVRVWDVRTGKPHVLIRSMERVEALAFSPDGRALVLAAGDRVRLWHPETNQVEDLAVDPEGRAFRAVAFSADGRALAAAGDATTVLVWDVTDGKPVRRRDLAAPDKGARALMFLAGGRFLAVGGPAGIVQLWDVAGTEKAQDLRMNGAVAALAYSRRDTRLVVDTDKAVEVWGHAGWTQWARSYQALEKMAPLFSVAVSPDGLLAAHGGSEGKVLVFSIPRAGNMGRPNTFPPAHTGAVRGLAFSANSDILATAADDGTVRFWDVTGFRGE